MILLHARGNEKIGIGNLARCYELVKFLAPNRDVKAIFECDEKLFSRFSQNAIRSENLEHSKELIYRLKPQIYINDLLDADKNLSDIARNAGARKIVSFNTLEYGFEPDALFIMDEFDYPAASGNFEVFRSFGYYIVGSDVVKRRAKFTPKTRLKNILLSFGGADPAMFSEYFTNVIANDGRLYTLVLGPAMSDERKARIKSVKKSNLSFIDSPANLIDLILNHDALVTLGGMSAYEAMTLGTPVCGVEWSYLAYVVRSFAELKMINNLGDIKNAYENLLNLNLASVNEICENAYLKISGDALAKIAKILDGFENERS